MFNRKKARSTPNVEPSPLSTPPASDTPVETVAPVAAAPPTAAALIDEDVPNLAPGEEPSIPPLGVGEERLLQVVHRADGNRNDIYLAHRRPDDDAMMGTGEPVRFVAIIRSTDQDPTDTSPPWAWQRGSTEREIYIRLAEALANAGLLPGNRATVDGNVQWFVDRIREHSPGVSPMEATNNWAATYVAACGEVLTAANACLEKANDAVGAREMTAKRPQHEASIQSFTRFAEEAEREFGPLYVAFEQTCIAARAAASELLATDPLRAELAMAMAFDEETLGRVATVKAILSATYGPTPAAFLRGLAQTNDLISNDQSDGNIFDAAAAQAATGERACPWCAETIKAAAVICRFCGRDVQVQSNVG